MVLLLVMLCLLMLGLLVEEGLVLVLEVVVESALLLLLRLPLLR